MPIPHSDKSLHLTERQRTVLEVIIKHIETHGIPPTRAEIAKTLGFKSINAAEDHLKALARKGAIALSASTSRGIQILTKMNHEIPVLVQKDKIDSYIDIKSTVFERSVDVFFKMPDATLRHLGILQGDLLAIHHTDKIVDHSVALISHNDKITLVEMLHLNQCKPYSIEGVVVGLIRPKI